MRDEGESEGRKTSEEAVVVIQETDHGGRGWEVVGTRGQSLGSR